MVEGIMTTIGYLQNVRSVIEEGTAILDKIVVKEKQSTSIPVHSLLATSFGTLDRDSIKMMDSKLKVIIVGTTRAIEKLDDLSWDSVVSSMMQNLLLECMEGSTISRADSLIKQGTHVFKFDGSASGSIVEEVKVWFMKLIADKDVIDDTKIDIIFLAKMVASTGATINSFETFFAKKERHERTIIDVGVLRYPDIEHPFFKLYRIKVTAWSDSTRLLFAQQDANGITGEFHSLQFRPRDAVIRKLKQEVLNHAISEAEGLFKVRNERDRKRGRFHEDVHEEESLFF